MTRKERRLEIEKKGEKGGDSEEKREGWRMRRKERRMEIKKEEEKAGD